MLRVPGGLPRPHSRGPWVGLGRALLSPLRPGGSAAAPRGVSGASRATWRGGAAGARPAGFPLSDPASLHPPAQDIQHTEDFLIKPESRVAQLDTSQWPLLLKVGRVLPNLVFPLLLSSGSGGVTPLQGAAHVVLCLQNSCYKVSPALSF